MTHLQQRMLKKASQKNNYKPKNRLSTKSITSIKEELKTPSSKKNKMSSQLEGDLNELHEADFQSHKGG